MANGERSGADLLDGPDPDSTADTIAPPLDRDALFDQRNAMSLRCSVLITSYNCGRYIREAVSSILDQLRPGDEVIVVDDASSDDSVEHLVSVRKRIRLIALPENRGSATARNIAAESAAGDLLIFLDGDDVALPGRLDAHRAAAVDGCDLSYGRIALIGPDDRFLGWHRATAQSSRIPLERQITYENPIPFSASAMSRDAFWRIGGFREDILSSEDRELWARALRRGARPRFINQYLSLYRRRAGSKTMDWRKKREAYDHVRTTLIRDLDLPPDRLADVGFRWRRNLSIANNAWQHSRFCGDRSAMLVAVGYGIAAAPRYAEFQALRLLENIVKAAHGHHSVEQI